MFSIDGEQWLELLNLSVTSKRNTEEYYDNLFKSALNHC